MKRSIFYICLACLLPAFAGCGDNRSNNAGNRADTTINMDNTPVYPNGRAINTPDTGMHYSDTERTGNQIR